MSLEKWALFSAVSPFSTFLKYSNQKKTAINAINSHIFEDKVGFIPERNGEKFRMLDIGCGSGEITAPIAAHIKDAIGKTPLVCLLDPSRDLIAIALQRLMDIGIPKGSINSIVSFFPMNEEDHSLERLLSLKSFNLILCSHALYYIGNWSKATTGMLNLLNDKGRVCISMQSEQGEQYQLRKRFIPFIDKSNQFLKQSVEEYCQLLTDLGIPFLLETLSSHILLPLEFEFSDEDFIAPQSSKNMQSQLYELVRLIEFLLRHEWMTVPLKIKLEMLEILRAKQSSKIYQIGQIDGLIWI